MYETNVAEVPQVSRPSRRTAITIVRAIGPLLMLAALLVFVWPQAPSDCHGSPVCALDAFAVLGKLMFAGFLGFVGLMWTIVAAAVTTNGHGESTSHQ
jgi:hypothetical protein